MSYKFRTENLVKASVVTLGIVKNTEVMQWCLIKSFLGYNYTLDVKTLRKAIPYSFVLLYGK